MRIVEDDSEYKYYNEETTPKEQSFNNFHIPKTIHQIWIGENKLPKKWVDSFQIDFKKSHPDWEYKIWTEKEIDQMELINQDIYEQEKSIVAKSDILRYEILYQFGGVYFDADILWLDNKPLDVLLTRTENTGLFVGREDHRVLGISVIGCSKNNDVMREVISELSKNYSHFRLNKKWAPWISTGPVLFTEVVKNFKIKIFPPHYFYPLSWHYDQTNANPDHFPDSYTIHYGYSTNNLKDIIE